jgi:oxalate decarboxylase/phosphoglucose isomerase-like protein (cupin superfamily)
MSTILFTPRGNDYQSSHEQDELYIVVKGGGVLMVAGDRHPITAETREFYKKVGFVPIETYPRLWGAELPILQFIKVL